MKFNCPKCQHEYDMPTAHIGQRAKCKSCSTVFHITAAPLEITPNPNLPFDQIVNKSSAEKPRLKSSGRFFVSLWTRSPAAFRTAFLSTLGVVCALWFSWSVMGLGRSLTAASNTPSKTESLQTSQNYALSNKQTAYLAATTVLIETYQEYSTLRQLRIEAAKNAVNDLHLGVLIRAILPPLENRYRAAQKYILPDEQRIRQVHGSILRAIESEYNLVSTTLACISDPDNVSALAAQQAAIEASKKADGESMLGVLTLMMQIDESFFDAYLAVCAE